MKKVAINGFGRIGRIFLRAVLEKKNKKFKVVAVNHPHGAENAAYLFKHDSVYGIYKGKVDFKGDDLIIDGQKIKIVSERDLNKLPWKKLGVDIVVESTGVFRKKKDAAKHLRRGAKRVVITAPTEDADASVVLGVNEKGAKKNYKIINMCSCTTGSLAPPVKILQDKFGIERVFFTTVHSYTNDQALQDGYHENVRRGRAAAQNIVPTTSGASISVEQVIPELKGKIAGLAIRVPTIDGSVTDFVAELKKPFTVKQINDEFKKAAKGKYKGIVEYSEDELVSSDIIGNKNSAIIDGLSTMKDGNLVKILAWYDNEYGYCNRLVELVDKMGV